MIPLSRPIINEEMINAATKALKEERLVNGESVRLFEQDFAEKFGYGYAATTNSGTSALFLSLMARGISEGDIVIVPSATFVATINSIIYTGATPLFVDVSLADYTIDVEMVQRAIDDYGDKVKAIVPVHLYGRPANMSKVMDIASKHQIFVLEDACQAHGAVYHGRYTGSLGHAAAFSFYSSKNMTVGGDGGMVVSNDPMLIDKVRVLRNQGSSEKNRYENRVIGFNFRLNTINAAIGRVQLKYIDSWLQNRRQISKWYLQGLKRFTDRINLPPTDGGIISAWHLFVIRYKLRDNLKDFLSAKGVETGIHYPIPAHLQLAYRGHKILSPYDG